MKMLRVIRALGFTWLVCDQSFLLFLTDGLNVEPKSPFYGNVNSRVQNWTIGQP